MDKVITVIWFLSASSWAQTPDNIATSRPACFTGWTGPNSGGSCSFNTSSLCDWKNVQGNDLLWTLTDDEQVRMSPDWWTDPELGRLRSPPLCGRPGQQVCLEVKFRFGSGGGSQLYAEMCGQQVVCLQLFHHEYRDNTDWLVEAVEFDSSGPFEIFIVGEKYKNTFGGESDIFIDYIMYNSTSCFEKATRVTSPAPPAVSSSSEAVSVETGTFTPTVTATSLLASSSIVPDSQETEREEGVASTLGVTVVGGGHTGTDGQGDKQNDGDKEDEEDKTLTVVIVSVSAVLLLLLVIALFVAVLLVRRRHCSAPRKTANQMSSVQFERNESLVMVTNQLYTCMGQPHPPASGLGEDTSGGQERQPTTERTSRSSDVYYSSTTRPVSSPPRVTSDDDGYEQQMIVAAAASPKHPGTDRSEDETYEITDTKAADEKAIYENTERGEEKAVYENTETRDTEPAGKKDGADGTYEKVEATEYSHLINSNNRPDRRQASYDHLGD